MNVCTINLLSIRPCMWTGTDRNIVWLTCLWLDLVCGRGLTEYCMINFLTITPIWYTGTYQNVFWGDVGKTQKEGKFIWFKYIYFPDLKNGYLFIYIRYIMLKNSLKIMLPLWFVFLSKGIFYQDMSCKRHIQNLNCRKEEVSRRQ